MASGKKPSSAHSSPAPSGSSGWPGARMAASMACASAGSSTSSRTGTAPVACQPDARRLVIRYRPALVRASSGATSAGSATLSKITSHPWWAASHCTAPSRSASSDSTPASAGCSATARPASPASISAGLAAVIHQVRLYSAARAAAHSAARVLLPTPPRPCTACTTTPPGPVMAASSRASSLSRPTNSPGRGRFDSPAGAASPAHGPNACSGSTVICSARYCTLTASSPAEAIPLMSPPAATDRPPGPGAAGDGGWSRRRRPVRLFTAGY